MSSAFMMDVYANAIMRMVFSSKRRIHRDHTYRQIVMWILKRVRWEAMEEAR